MKQEIVEVDVLIVGGGVVGLSILHACVLKGWKCALVESEECLLKWASGSNSGIVCTGVDATPGTLERALIRDSVARILPHMSQMNIPNRACGSLVCQWPWDNSDNDNHVENHDKNIHNINNHKLHAVLEESHEAGDTHASLLTETEVRKMEPNLNPACQGAVHIPGEMVVDPWLFSIAYAVQARENGALIYTNWKLNADATQFDDSTKTWTAIPTANNSNSGPTKIIAKAVVNAAGLWSDTIQRQLQEQHDSSSKTIADQWHSKPRRGQYRVFQSTPFTRLQHPIQPIPTQFTKGIFVFGTLYDQLCVGPTALDQESKTDRSIDSRVSRELTQLGQQILPRLNPTKDHVGDYVGLRPGTNHRDYQIHLMASCHMVAATGIRSTGLTASLGIGRHVTHLLSHILSIPSHPPKIQATPLPSLPELLHDFHTRGQQQSVMIHGHEYQVTHPITRLGWKARTGLASSSVSPQLQSKL